LKLQNSDSKLQNVDLKLQNSDSKLQTLDSKLPNGDSKLQNHAKMAERSMSRPVPQPIWRFSGPRSRLNRKHHQPLRRASR
jgi:hypothetical protein